MKNVLAFFMITTALVGAGVLLQAENPKSIQGTVSESGNPLWVAQVALYDSSHQSIRKTFTNEFGQFVFDSLPTGRYFLEVSHPSFQKSQQEVSVDDGITLVKIELVSLLVEKEKEDDIRNLEKEKRMLSPKKPLKSRGEPVPSEMDYISETYESLAAPRIEPGEAPKASPGTLTAGEINDFSKWVLWEDLTETKFQKFQEQWGFYAKNRYSVQATLENGQPIVDAVVRLLSDKNEVVFLARTDNTGKAELWADLIPEIKNQMARRYKAVVHYRGKEYPFPKLDAFPNGINTLKIKGVCEISDVLDIAFVVDATGSMGDEINYLKEELKDVIERVQADNSSLSIRTSSVFYRDHGDAYLTRLSPFSGDISNTLNFIQKQYAGGGGDFPEAVDEALDAALNKLSWSPNARGRILFLVLDAPPHQADSVVQRMHQLVIKAAAMGVRIIPITGSGINKDVEFLMRSMALATNSTYVFLTDHSGVGTKHLAPSTDDFEVQKLNDLMVNIINRYAATTPCSVVLETPTADSSNTEIPVHVSSDSTNLNYELLELTCYPVPSSGPITFEVSHAGGFIYIVDANGKMLLRYSMTEQKKWQANLANLSSGYYFVRYELNGKWVCQKILLIHS